MLTKQELYERLSLKTAFFMVLISVPALVLSLYGALADDGAFTPVIVQSVLFLFLVIASIPVLPLSYKQRLLISTAVIFIAGAVAVIRYANVTIGYTYSLIITLMMTLILPRLGLYVLLALLNFMVGAVAVVLFELTVVRVMLQFVTFTGLTAIGLEIILAMISFHRVNATEIENEKRRQEVVSSEANIAFIEFDYESGLLSGDETNAIRFGRTVSDGPISIDEYAHLFPVQTLTQLKSEISEASKKHSGSSINFVHSMLELRDDQVHQYRVTGVNLYRNGKLHFLGVSLDITDEQRAIETAESKTKLLTLEQERQKQMYAVIGHELRTPAASMKMLLDDLGENESLDHSQIAGNVEQLLSVIETLRAVAQPERMAQAAFSNVRLDELLSSQLSNLKGLADRHGVTLSQNLAGLKFEAVHVQASLLRQVTDNLIKNAVIHSGGSHVLLSAESKQLGGNKKALRIIVSDNGAGIEKEQQSKLFKAYERGNTSAEGTGLGLFICREIVALMGGDLRYQTSQEGGAEFVISLEVEYAKEQNRESEPTENLIKGKRVLMAEDNGVIQMLTIKMLEKQGASVVACNDGREALSVWEPSAFDLILSDIFMPELDGYGFVKGLRDKGYAGPIVGLTAATIGAETDLMLASGADIVLSKPIELAKLQQFLLDYGALARDED